MRYQLALATRLGDRPSNQDRCAALERDGAVLLVLADGMGGHARGELAAQTLVDSLRDSFNAANLPVNAPRAFLRQALERAHVAVVENGHAQHPPVQPRTTAVACLVQGDRAHWAHVGDSRLYLVRAGTVGFRTQDHTYVQELQRHGMLSTEQLRRHPLRNYVTRCIGGGLEAPVITEGPETVLEPADVVLLCSDGLWSAVPESDLRAVGEAESLETTLDALAEAAQKATYPQSDNISVVALRWHDARPTAASETESRPASAASPGDSLTCAIAEIRQALREYGGEMGD